MNHWDPVLYENRTLVPRSPDPDYHLTEDLADRAIEWTRRGTDTGSAVDFTDELPFTFTGRIEHVAVDLP